MATTDYRYAINGVVSTDKTVLQNLDALAQATGAWLTYDINQGRWAVVINRAGNAVASFGDHNIIGTITVSGTALTSMYNSVQVQFPHVDLKNTTDSVLIEIPLVDRNPNEPERQLNLSTDLVIDPVQAQLIGYMELQQSRIDTTISFVTDFTSLGLKAGDIIDVSSSIYGLTNTKFRIITIRESDTDGGEIQLAITAQLYSDAVYDTTGLTRLIRTSDTGIVGIGNIGRPGVPTVTLSSTNATPHVTITSSAPSGVVTGMEFHYSTDTDVVYDENRIYNLAGTTTAANGTFAFGETVRFDYYDAPAGNLIVKTRGINSTTVGLFSQPTGNVTYTPKTAAGAITNATKVVDSTGALVTSLGASFLLSQLADLIKGNTAPGGLLSTILSKVSTKSGTQPGTGGYAFYNGPPPHAIDGYNYNLRTQWFQVNEGKFTPKISGLYNLQNSYNIASVSGSSSTTPSLNTILATVRTNDYYTGSLNSVTATNLFASSTTGIEAQLYSIPGAGLMLLEQPIYLVAGTTYYLDTFYNVDPEFDYVIPTIKVQNLGLTGSANISTPVGSHGGNAATGNASPTASSLLQVQYNVFGNSYTNQNIVIDTGNTIVDVELTFSQNYGSGSITIGTDVYDAQVFASLMNTTLDLSGYNPGTYTPYFAFWEQDEDTAGSPSISLTLPSISIIEEDPANTEFAPEDEEVITEEEPQPDIEYDFGDYPEPEYDLTDYGDL